MPKKNNYEYKIVKSLFNDNVGKSCLLKEYTSPSDDIDILEIPAYIGGIPVRYIDSDFWFGVPYLREIRFPETLITPCCTDTEKYIELDLRYHDRLKSISVSEDNPWLFSEDGVLYISGPEKKKLNSILYFYPSGKQEKEFTVLEGCTSIFKHAFEEVSTIEKVNPSSVKEIGEDAFSDCKNLKTIDLSNVEVIEYGGFSSCESIREVRLSSKIKVKSHAFWYCTGLKKFYLESADVDLSSCYLGYASKLKKIDILSKALSRFTYINGILYSFSEEGISPEFCPSDYPQKEIFLPDFVDFFESNAFCGNPDEDRIIYYSKGTEFIYNTFDSNKFKCIDITNQKTKSIIENNGYLLYVPGPVQEKLDLSGIHDFGEIAFRDLKRVKQLIVGNNLSYEKIRYIQSLVQIDMIEDRPWLVYNTGSVNYHKRNISDSDNNNHYWGKVIVSENDEIIVTPSSSCINKKHDVKQIEIQVRVLCKRIVSVVSLKGEVCCNCGKCYVRSRDFANFLNNLAPDAKIIQNRFKTARKRYGEVYYSPESNFGLEGAKEQSFLKWCGYSINASSVFWENGKIQKTSGRDLLISIIDSGLMTKNEVIKYLTYFINLNRNVIRNRCAVNQWIQDLKEIMNFEPTDKMKDVRRLIIKK